MYLLLLFIYIYTNIINYTVIFTLLISQYYTKLYAAAAMFSVIETTTERIMFLKVVYYDERFGVFIVLKKKFLIGY